MRFPDAFRYMMRSRGLTRQDVADRTGRGVGAVHDAIRKGNPSVRVLDEYARACGYTVALVPAGSRLPEGAVELEGGR